MAGPELRCSQCQEMFGVPHSEMVSRFKQDYFLTAKLLAGNHDLSENFHLPIARYLQNREMVDGVQRFLVMFPRGHFKTSMLSLGYVVWRIIRNPNVRILLLHASGSMSEKWIQALMGRLKSPVFLHFFGHLIPDNPRAEGRRWTSTQIEVRRDQNWPEATVTSAGVTSTVTGGHFDVQIFDDVVEQLASRSPSIMQRTIEFLETSDALFVRPSQGTRYVVGTWWPGGFYEKLMRSKVYDKIIFGCYVDDRFRDVAERCGIDTSELVDGEPVFPERFSAAELDRMAVEMGTTQFSHQMLNIAVSDDMMRFKENELTFYTYRADTDVCVYGEVQYPVKQMLVTVTVDPATGENSKTDESAISVCGYHRESGHIFVLDEWGGRVLPHALIDKILYFANKWRADSIGIEHTSFQVVLKHYLQDEMRRRDLHFRIDPIKVGQRSKVERIIDGLQPYISSGQVHFLKQHRRTLIAEMLRLNVVQAAHGMRFAGRSPNRVDALAMQVRYWGGRARQQERYDPADFDDTIGDVVSIESSPIFGLRSFT